LPKGALSVSDRSSRLARTRLDELGPTLVMAAQQMSSEIAAQYF
jgi:IclR family acetate operon transcriptional repressor